MIQRHVVQTYTQLLGRQLGTCSSITRPLVSRRVPTSSLLGNGHFVSRRFGGSSTRNTAATVVIPAISPKSVLGKKESNDEDPSSKSKISLEENGATISSSASAQNTSKEEANTSSSSSTLSTKSKRVGISEVEKGIKEAKDVKTLLELAPSISGLKNSCQLLHALGLLVKNGKAPNLDLEDLQKDARFIRVTKIVRKASYTPVPALLLFALQSVESIGFTSENDLVKDLEHELKWIMRRCPVRFIARTINTFSTGKLDIAEAEGLGVEVHSNAKAQQLDKLPPSHPLITAIQTLQRRWVEIATGSEFISTFRVFSHLPNETREKLEDRAVELVQDFSILEMIKIFIALSNQKRRPTPLLRALAFHVAKSTETIPTKDLIELVYALNELTFADPVLMEKLCSDLHSSIPSIESPAQISSLVVSLGRMRYYHKDLVNVLAEWLTKNLNDLRLFDCAAWILASSVLNLNPSMYPPVYEKAKSMLTPQAIPNPVEWLNVVHAMSVLNMISTETVSTVLTPEFIGKIDINETLTPSKTKLLHMNAIAKASEQFGLGVYNGKFISEERVTKWTSTLTPNDAKLSKLVVESLGHFLPPPKYMLADIKSETGVYIDASCLVSEKLDPLPVASTLKSKKVALLVQGYPALTLGTKVPTGSTALSTRLLEIEGYHVIPVPYTEFTSKEKLVTRVQYLERKIRNAEIFANAPDASRGDSSQIQRSSNPSSNLKR